MWMLFLHECVIVCHVCLQYIYFLFLDSILYINCAFPRIDNDIVNVVNVVWIALHAESVCTPYAYIVYIEGTHWITNIYLLIRRSGWCDEETEFWALVGYKWQHTDTYTNSYEYRICRFIRKWLKWFSLDSKCSIHVSITLLNRIHESV